MGLTSKARPGSLAATPRILAAPKSLPQAHRREVAAAALAQEQQDSVSQRSLSDSEVDRDTFKRRLNRTQIGLEVALAVTRKRRWTPDEDNAIRVRYIHHEDKWKYPTEGFTCPGAIESDTIRSLTPDNRAVPYRRALKRHKLHWTHRTGTASEGPPPHRRRQGSRGRAIAPRTGVSEIPRDAVPHFPDGPNDYRAHQRTINGVQWQVDPGTDPAHPRRLMRVAGVGQINVRTGKLADVEDPNSWYRPPREAHVIDCTIIDDPRKMYLRKHDGRHHEIIDGVMSHREFPQLGLPFVDYIVAALDGNQVTLYLACNGNKHRSLAAHMILLGMCVHLDCYFHTFPVAKDGGKWCTAARSNAEGFRGVKVPCEFCLDLAAWPKGTWSGLGRRALLELGYTDTGIARIRPQQRAALRDKVSSGAVRPPKLPIR